MGEESRGETFGVFASYKTVFVFALENVGQVDFEYIAMWSYKTMNNSEIFFIK